MNFLAASSLSPSTVLGMYIAMPGQMVIPLVAASGPGSGKKPTSLRLAGSDVLDVRRDTAELRIMRRRARGDCLDTVVELGRGEVLVEVAGLMDLLGCAGIQPARQAYVAYLAWPAVYFAAKSGT